MGFIEQGLKGVAILLWASSDQTPQLLATPFFMAATAAAMDAQVEIYFSARSVRLLLPGVAAALRASELAPQTIFDHMLQAHKFGACFFACSDALRAHGIENAPLIEQCSGHSGATSYMARVLDSNWRVLTF
jgi:predicted peroxiredoxin